MSERSETHCPEPSGSTIFYDNEVEFCDGKNYVKYSKDQIARLLPAFEMWIKGENRYSEFYDIHSRSLD